MRLLAGLPPRPRNQVAFTPKRELLVAIEPLRVYR